jgi:membrane protease YdiL (CAAX protease family)
VHSWLLAQIQVDENVIGNILTWVVLAAGMVVLCRWLLATKLGCRALLEAPKRRNLLPLAAPFAVLLAWMLASLVVSMLAEKAGKAWGLEDWAKTAALYGGMIGVDVGLIALMCCMGRVYFARRLRGFGLDLRNIGGDLWQGAGTLLAVLPAVLAMISAVMLVGRLIEGEKFQMQENEGLKALLKYPQVWLKIMVFIFAGVVVPIYEELLFRGLFQSAIRGFVGAACRGWAAALVTSGMFAILHPPMHWPALFVLSLAIGYTYEKSGSLVRAIVVHSLFNISMMLMSLAN